MLAVATCGLVLVPTDAWADAGLVLAGDTTYSLRAADSVVDVSEAITVTNVKPDQTESSGVRRFYYDAVTVPVPVDAANVVATSDGDALAVAVAVAGNGKLAPARVGFANLYFGQSRTMVLTYSLPGSAPRTDDVARINPAYASFVALAVGDPGKVSVHVVVPDSFAVETFGASVGQHHEGTTVVYEASDIASPDDWYVLVSARLDGALRSSDVDIDDRQVSVRAWPNDAEWATWVEGQLRDGVPTLQDLVGQPWPLTRRLDIVEAFTPNLRGYGGWFQPLESRIEVGEDLDQRLLLHELSHAWFNRSFFSARWIDEGMAEEYSSRAVAKLGGPLDDPKAVDAGNPNAVKLEHWEVPAKRSGAGDVEDFGYNASWWTIRQITDEIGMDKMAAVVAAGFAHVAAYPGKDTAEPTTSASDWRRFLDLLESVGGSTKAASAFRAVVLNQTERGEVSVRATTRTTYASLATAGAGWFVPAGVRARMEQWDFAGATEQMVAANSVLATRNTLRTEADAAALTLAAGDEAAYEKALSSVELATVQRDEKRRLDAVRAIVAARTAVGAPRNRATRLGFWHRDAPEPLLGDAARAFAVDDTTTAAAAAAQATLMVADAASLGRRRLRVGTNVAIGLLLALLLATTLLVVTAGRRRGRVAFAGALAARDVGTGTGPVPAPWSPAGWSTITAASTPTVTPAPAVPPPPGTWPAPVWPAPPGRPPLPPEKLRSPPPP